MADAWETKQILITVKTYPTPAWKGGEVVCTAGITAEGDWIRLFPIPFRFLQDNQKYKKYEWIEAKVTRSNDPRAESYRVDADSIRVIGPLLGPKNNWASRKNVILPHLAPSMCWLRKERNTYTIYPTLGIIQPKEIKRFRIVPTDREWQPKELGRLLQTNFISGSIQQLEKVPFDFYYDFYCLEPGCKGHKMSCVDWEIFQSYRKWSKGKDKSEWEVLFRQKYEHEMITKNDTLLYVGTVHGHPNSWVIIGLFYPGKVASSVAQTRLFD